MNETYIKTYIIYNIVFFLIFLNSSLVRADNATNYTFPSNVVLIPSTVENCPSKMCTYVWGFVLNVSFHQPWSFRLGSLFCQAQAIETGSFDTSYWQQICTYPINATDAQKDTAQIPLSLIKAMGLENQTQIMSENKDLNSQVVYLKIILVIVSIIAAIFILYYWYTEHWQFRAKP